MAVNNDATVPPPTSQTFSMNAYTARQSCERFCVMNTHRGTFAFGCSSWLFARISSA
jgi:hypothetical protein